MKNSTVRFQCHVKKGCMASSAALFELTCLIKPAKVLLIWAVLSYLVVGDLQQVQHHFMSTHVF